MLYNPPTGSVDPNASYVGKDVVAGTQGSKVPKMAVEATQREIVNAERAAGLTPTNSDLTQLLQAISRGIFIGNLGGSANAQTGAIPASIVIPTLLPGMRFQAVATVTNSGPATLSITGAGGGAMPLLRQNGGALQGKEIPTGVPFEVMYDGSGWRLVLPSAAEIGVRKIQIYNASGSWTCPEGVFFALFEEWAGGGGGGGGNGTGQSAGGGAGGAYTAAFLPVVPGTTYNFTIGAGGTGGPVGATSASNGAQGGTSSIVVGATTLTATGGGGGQGGAVGALGGTPTTGAGGDEVITGGQGGNYFSGTVGGRGGEAPRGGAGSGAGNNGNSPGGGAGGGSVSQPGATGAAGRLRITY